MSRLEAIKLIDDHKNALLDPVAMLHWTWLRVILDQMTDEVWNAAYEKAVPILSR